LGPVVGGDDSHVQEGPLVFGRNLQCQPVRKWTPEKNAIGHTLGSASSGAVNLNSILECKILFKPGHRACRG
jgi:hypothetical protein